MTAVLLSGLGLIAAIVATEYLLRVLAIFWLPVLGSLRVNDMLLSGAGYAALVWLTMPAEKRNIIDIRQTLGEIWLHIHDRRTQMAAALALGAGWLTFVDEFLWGHVELPYLPSPWQSDTVLFEPAGTALAAVSLLLVNGPGVPLAEEWLWRGLVQPRFVAVLGTLPGLVIVSILFSLKHAVVDALLGRLLALTTFGIVMGVTALRRGWRASALAHALANTIATILGLIISLSLHFKNLIQPIGCRCHRRSDQPGIGLAASTTDSGGALPESGAGHHRR